MIRYILFALIAIIPLRLNAQLTDIDLTNITVMADRALTVPLSKLASDYSRKNSVTITIGYAPSFEQTIEIQEGEAADLFISAHPKSIERLEQRGLFDINSLKPLVKAKLALIYTGDKKSIPSSGNIKAIIKQPVAFTAIASPAATAEGFYAQQALKHFSSKHQLSVAEMPDTESMLSLLKKTPEPAFAIMFEPDALLNIDSKIAGIIPDEWHENAVFVSAIVPGGSTTAARKFQKFLSSEEAQREFIKYRFYPVSKSK